VYEKNAKIHINNQFYAFYTIHWTGNVMNKTRLSSINHNMWNREARYQEIPFVVVGVGIMDRAFSCASVCLLFALFFAPYRKKRLKIFVPKTQKSPNLVGIYWLATPTELNKTYLRGRLLDFHSFWRLNHRSLI